jgi:phosphoribosylamine-glycine ligase
MIVLLPNSGRRLFFLETLPPFVLKADGLAGKGVLIIQDLAAQSENLVQPACSN